jgi:hypothetical protein
MCKILHIFVKKILQLCVKLCLVGLGSRCGSAVKWWKWENKWNQEDPGLLPTPGNLFFKKGLGAGAFPAKHDFSPGTFSRKHVQTYLTISRKWIPPKFNNFAKMNSAKIMQIFASLIQFILQASFLIRENLD